MKNFDELEEEFHAKGRKKRYFYACLGIVYGIVFIIAYDYFFVGYFFH